jgi:Fe-S-cluster containining protein
MPDPATPVPGDAHEPETVAGRMKLRMGPHEVELHANVPKDEVPLRLVLPLARLLSDAIVAVADAEVAASDERISCTKGCGACCRQLVPVSMPEIRALRALVAAMPEPRRSAVQARFAEAMLPARDSGWLARAAEILKGAPMGLDAIALGIEYFHLDIACPFLEDESCSIYADRPTVCREYLVLSPAANCRDPRPETIRRVKLYGNVSRALRNLGHDRNGRRWLPLTFALHWEDDAAEPEKTMAGTEWAAALLREVTGKDLPAAQGPGMADDVNAGPA